jgi:hypothetical protein
VSKGVRGGGIGVVVSDNIKIELLPQQTFRSFEMMTLKIKACRPLTVVLIYRPPPSAKNGLTTPEFLSEAEEFLTHLCTMHPGDLCVVGDFNLHYDVKDNQHANTFKGVLASLELIQHVDLPTHRGHTLELLITRAESVHPLVSSICVSESSLSDHYPVFFKVCVKTVSPPSIMTSCRPLRNVNPNELAQDIITSLDTEHAQMDSDPAAHYNKVVTSCLDKQAPMKTIHLKGCEKKLWYSDIIHDARKKRRQLERKYNKSRLEVHKQMFHEQEVAVVSLIDQNKANYYKEKLKAADSKGTFKVINGLLGSKQSMQIPCDSPKERAQGFADFFISKVQKIRSSLDLAGQASTHPDHIKPV